MSRLVYRLERKLGSSYIGSTYQGVVQLPDGEERQILLKLLAPHLAQDPVVISHLVGYFDELRGVAHHGLAPLWDFGTAGDYYFIVREFLPGITLKDLLKMVEKEQIALSPAMACYIATEVATAVYALHSHRSNSNQPIYLYHGGLTPKNVLLTRIGSVAIADAGLDVIFWRDHEYSSWLIQEKSQYQPPEYSMGQRPMRRNDTYSVAAILYEMLIGPPLQRVFQAQAPGVPFPSPSQFNQRVTPALDEMLLWALNPDVEFRCNQIDQFHNGLSQPDLFLQHSVEKREAMDFIQALAQRDLNKGDASPDALIFDYPFQLDSLLPVRSEYLPPWERYRPPVFENTDSYPQLNDKHTESTDAEFALSTSISVIFPEDELERLDSISPAEGSGTSVLEHLEQQDEPTRAGSPVFTPPKSNPFVESTVAAPLPEVEDEATNVTPLLEILESEGFVQETQPAPIIPELELELSEEDELPELVEEHTQATPLEEIAESTRETSALKEPQDFPFASNPPDPNNTLHKGSPSLDDFAQLGLLPDEEQVEKTNATYPAPQAPEPEISPEPVSSIPAINPDESDDEDIHQLARSYLDSPELEEEPPPPPKSMSEALASSPFPSLPNLRGGFAPPPPPVPSDAATAAELPRIEPTANLPIEAVEEPNSRLPRPAESDGPTSTEARPQKGMEETLKGGKKLLENTLKGADSVVNEPTEFETSAVPPLSPPTLPATTAVPTQQLLEAVPPHGSPGASMSFDAPPQWLQGGGGNVFGNNAASRDEARPLPRTVALPIEAVEGYPGNSGRYEKPPVPSTPEPSRELKVGEELFGKFLLLERVALGGMAEVFKARIDGISGFQRLLAIKRILPNYSEDPHFQRMFKDEARIAGSLMHPNIVQIHELGEYDGVLYISMEFIDGIDLSRAIKIRRLLQQPIPLEIILQVAILVCRALHYAHEARDLNGEPLKMIHRDVTPHNILLSKSGEAKITDFGVAKAAQNSSETAAGELKGKLSYLSPEQIHATPLTRSSDIYQVGILMYELLTLRKMIEGKSDREIFRMIAEAGYANLLSIAPEIPPALRLIVEKALSLKPEHRFSSAQEMEEALLQFQSQERVSLDPSQLARFVNQVLDQREEILSQQSKQRAQHNHQFSVWDNPPNTDEPPSHTQPPVLQPASSDEEITDELHQVQQKQNRQKGRSGGTVLIHQEKEKKASLGMLLGLVVAAIFLVVGTTLGVVWWLKPRKISLTVQTTPADATVLIDGEEIGQTPLQNKKLPFDKSTHLLQIQKRGFRVVTRKFKMTPGKPLKFKVMLTPVLRRR